VQKYNIGTNPNRVNPNGKFCRCFFTTLHFLPLFWHHGKIVVLNFGTIVHRSKGARCPCASAKSSGNSCGCLAPVQKLVQKLEVELAGYTVYNIVYRVRQGNKTNNTEKFTFEVAN